MSEVTRILNALADGDPQAANELIPLVYGELRKLAAHKMAGEAPGHTLQPTALVHEAWLRLGADNPAGWKNRAHFFGAAAEAMRRILVDRARRRQAQRRGGGAEHVPFEEIEIAGPEDDDKLLLIHEALDRLASANSRKAELVKLRYFAGMTFEEAATVLDIAVPTAKEWWAYARAWLAVEIRGRNRP